MSKLTKNLGYQTIYQILAICLPIITSPYISRVLNADGLGVYSYTYSVVNYFTLFAMLGVLNYGSRSIAFVKNDPQELSHTFWSIYALQLITASISAFIYIIYAFAFPIQNRLIALIQTIWILGCILDISWLFFGLEEFRLTVVRNSIIKFLTLVCIFVFIKNSDDVWIYTVIMSAGTLLSQAVLWPFVRRHVSFYRPSFKEIIRHIGQNIMLFIPLAGMSIYHIMDKTMLGYYGDYNQVGYYYNADKVINIPLCVINAAGVVMLPKISALVSQGKHEESEKLIDLSMQVFIFLTVAMSLGIAAVSKEFSPLFFGPGYDQCVLLIIILSFVMIFKSVSDLIRNQYLIPYNLAKLNNYSVLAGALINLIMNYVFIFILRLGAMGASFSTLITEASVCAFYIIAVFKRVNILNSIKNSAFYLVAGAVMFMAVRLFARDFNATVIHLLLEIVLGGSVYMGLCFTYWIITKNKNIINILKYHS